MIRSIEQHLAGYLAVGERLTSAICNDFNLDDPQVVVLAETTNAEGLAEKRLIWVQINRRRAPYCWASHTDFEPGLPKSIVDRVVSHGIRLSSDLINDLNEE